MARSSWLSGASATASLRGSRVLAPAAVVAIGALDVVAALGDWPVPVAAALDWPAHLLTAWLVLHALPGHGRSRRFVRWVLVGSVAIDLDHLPLYLGDPGFLVGGSRPPTHSLVVAAALALLAWRRRWRTPAAGLSVGVVLHLLRDIATGPGAPVLWPLDDVVVRVPYLLYAAVLVVAAGLTAGPRRGSMRIPGRPRPGEAADAGAAGT